MSTISYRNIVFDNTIAKFEELTLYRPNLPGPDWAYLGPIAATPESQDKVCYNLPTQILTHLLTIPSPPPSRHGLIVKADTPSALGDIVDWKPIFINIEGGKFSTWRGIPSDPSRYTAIGDFFIPGIEKPSPSNTAGIKAIRNDLIELVEPHHLVYKKVIPFAVLTLWDVFAAVPRFIQTGAFLSSHGESSDGKIDVLRLDL